MSLLRSPITADACCRSVGGRVGRWPIAKRRGSALPASKAGGRLDLVESRLRRSAVLSPQMIRLRRRRACSQSALSRIDNSHEPSITASSNALVSLHIQCWSRLPAIRPVCAMYYDI
jgi:hypothetical protein